MSKGSSVIVTPVMQCVPVPLLLSWHLPYQMIPEEPRMTPIIITQIIKTVGLTFFLRISHAHSKVRSNGRRFWTNLIKQLLNNDRLLSIADL